MGREMGRIVSAFFFFFFLAFVGMMMSSITATDSFVETLVKENLKIGRVLISQYKTYFDHNVSNKFVINDDDDDHVYSKRMSNMMVACSMLYDKGEELVDKVLQLQVDSKEEDFEDGRMWLSSVITSHMSCLDGLNERGWFGHKYFPVDAQNLTSVLTNSLAVYAKKANRRRPSKVSLSHEEDQYTGILKSWNPSSSKADIIVAKDGSGDYRTIREAVSALSGYKGDSRRRRVIIYVKSGTYKEQVIIRKGTDNLMFVGDGIGNTIVTGNRNYIDGDSTVTSATFAVFGDGFWARDMTFENTAGPEKHQAVALMVNSDKSLFYKCSFKAYQDTLYAYTLRQFYRDCQIHGTIDFIFGNAAAVFQNCDIIVRKPMGHQSNMVTASGRDNSDMPTGFSIHGSRIIASVELERVKKSFWTFLGRPWKEYARVVVWRTEIDGMIDPKGWTEWRGGDGMSTLFYAEYMNSGAGANTSGRVDWPGFHVLKNRRDVTPFNVRNFIQGETWVAGSGVPVWLED